MATGNGLARATHGCPGIGLCVHARPPSGLKVTGCDDLAAGSGWRATGSKRIPAIDKIDCIAKGIDLLDVAVKAFLPSRASILHAPQQAEANCHSRIRYGLAESFPFYRADLFQAALNGLSSAAVRRAIRTSLADKWRGNFLYAAIRQTNGILHSGPEYGTIAQSALGRVLRQWLTCTRLDDNPCRLSKS